MTRCLVYLYLLVEKYFGIGDNWFIYLTKLYNSFKVHKNYWELYLTNWYPYFLLMKGFTSLETLKLSYVLVPDLRCIWKGLVPCNLTTLEVNECKRLTHVFTNSMIASLLQLEILEISDCEELEQIIAKDNDDEKDQIFSGSDLQSACFPNLCRLEIRGCNKLKSLFPVAMASGLKKLQILEYVFPVSVSPSLQNLEEMEIREADNLKQVFYSGDGDDIIVKSKIKDGIIDFPQLRKLSLSKCSFFGPKDFAAQLPSLQCLSISGHEEWGNLLAQLQVRPLYFSIFFLF